MNESGCDAHSKGVIPKTVEEALEYLLSRAVPISDRELLSCTDALGRVLAEPLTSPIMVPPWDNSAMDGYAFHSADLEGERPRLRVTQRIPAGSVGEPLQRGTAARIFTGAPMPTGADTVVIQEVCEREGDEVIITEPPRPGANVRLAGEELREGEEILQPGVRLGPQHLGLAASVGIAEIPVYRKLKVALFSSGDELVLPGNSLGPGQIYDSNRFTLTGLLESLGCEVIDLGQIADSFEDTCDALQKGAEQADLILASGGVSVGEEDHVRPAVERLGSLDLWKIAVRPGKPLAFGHIGDTPFIGAPGNPVSLFVTFCIFARPFILKRQGVAGGLLPRPVRAVAGFERPKADKRREYARARLEYSGEGEPEVHLFPNRSSAMLSSLAWAEGLVAIPENRALAEGDRVNFLPFSELLR